MSTLAVTRDRLCRYIQEVELPERSRQVTRSRAETIVRKGGFVGSVIEHRPRLGRTMERARAHIEQIERDQKSVSSGTLFLADQLDDSKGRFTRHWHAPPGGLWGSMIYVSTLLPDTRLLVPLAIGIACCESLHRIGVDGAELRWINDVLANGKKVAGILMEGFYGAFSKEEYTLIGFGININNNEFPAALGGSAISAGICLGQPVDLVAFTCCFLAKLSWNLGLLHHEEDCFLANGEWSDRQQNHPLVERWCQLSSTMGRRVLFGFDVMGKPQYRATVTGISATGGLQLRLDDGTETVEHSGEIRYLD